MTPAVFTVVNSPEGSALFVAVLQVYGGAYESAIFSDRDEAERWVIGQQERWYAAAVYAEEFPGPA